MSSGTDKIVSNILSDAQSEVDIILKDAENEKNSIIKDGQKKAETVKEKILDDAKKQSNMKYQQLLSEAKMNARRAKLKAREDLIEEAFKNAEEEIKELANSSSDEYISSLSNIITEAGIEVGGGELIIYLKNNDKDKINNQLNNITKDIESQTNTKTSLEIGDPVNTIGGAIVKTKNGKIEVNNTIEARLSRFKKFLRSDVANILFN